MGLLKVKRGGIFNSTARMQIYWPIEVIVSGWIKLWSLQRANHLLDIWVDVLLKYMPPYSSSIPHLFMLIASMRFDFLFCTQMAYKLQQTCIIMIDCGRHILVQCNVRITNTFANYMQIIVIFSTIVIELKWKIKFTITMWFL